MIGCVGSYVDGHKGWAGKTDKVTHLGSVDRSRSSGFHENGCYEHDQTMDPVGSSTSM